MTTLKPEQKDILEKLNEIALEVNWGTVERANGVPKAVAVIQEAMEEIKRLREQNERLYTFKRKLEDELVENGFAEYADENFKTLANYRTAIKEILQKWYDDVVKGLGENGDYIIEIANKYGIILDEKN